MTATAVAAAAAGGGPSWRADTHLAVFTDFDSQPEPTEHSSIWMLASRPVQSVSGATRPSNLHLFQLPSTPPPPIPQMPPISS